MALNKMHPLFQPSAFCCHCSLILSIHFTFRQHLQVPGQGSTQLYQISLLFGYGNLAQGGNLIQGGGRLQTVLQGPRLTKSSAVFCKSHLPLLIPGWKTKNYHPKTLFWSQKRSIFLGFHEFPKMGVTCSSNPHFRKFVILLLLLMPGLLQWF